MKSFKRINKSVVLKSLENELLNKNIQAVSFYISNNFLDVLNVMCFWIECKYEDWKDGILMDVSDKTLIDEIEKAFEDFDGKSVIVNIFLAENLIDMYNSY